MRKLNPQTYKLQWAVDNRGKHMRVGVPGKAESECVLCTTRTLQPQPGRGGVKRMRPSMLVMSMQVYTSGFVMAPCYLCWSMRSTVCLCFYVSVCLWVHIVNACPASLLARPGHREPPYPPGWEGSTVSSERAPESRIPSGIPSLLKLFSNHWYSHKHLKYGKNRSWRLALL